MTHGMTCRKLTVSALALIVLAGCEDGFDVDLRGLDGGFTTAPAAQSATATRPEPDNRGVISYPNYQVAVAQRGDTVADVAARVGTDGAALASFNGVALDARLRAGEVIVLPNRVSEPSPATGATTTGPITPETVDVSTLAGEAIARAPDTTPAPAPTAPNTNVSTTSTQEPIRHKVSRGETAFSIARLYNVRPRDLAKWNGLGPQFAIREGQFLLIPVSATTTAAPGPTTAPGQGTDTPTPPSAAKPLPEEDIAPAAQAEKPAETPIADLGAQTKPTQSAGKFAFPVAGSVIREYTKGRNDGIDIKGQPGAPVKAADAGTVAAITQSAEGVPIIVIRHDDNILTVYANVTDVLVKKGDTVRRGQGIAKLRSGDQSFVHFEVRDGFDSVDPNLFLG